MGSSGFELYGMNFNIFVGPTTADLVETPMGFDFESDSETKSDVLISDAMNPPSTESYLPQECEEPLSMNDYLRLEDNLLLPHLDEIENHKA